MRNYCQSKEKMLYLGGKMIFAPPSRLESWTVARRNLVRISRYTSNTIYVHGAQAFSYLCPPQRNGCVPVLSRPRVTAAEKLRTAPRLPEGPKIFPNWHLFSGICISRPSPDKQDAAPFIRLAAHLPLCRAGVNFYCNFPPDWLVPLSVPWRSKCQLLC